MAVENREGKEEEMQYTSRGMRRRRDTDKWEVTLSHKDPITGEQVRTFYTIEAKTEKQAQRKRDEPILELERKGAAAGSTMTVQPSATGLTASPGAPPTTALPSDRR